MAIYDYIVAYKRKHDGNSPSVRGIMYATGLTSTSLVSYYLEKLEELGLIKLTSAVARGIEIEGGKWNYSRPDELDQVDPRQLKLFEVKE